MDTQRNLVQGDRHLSVGQPDEAIIYYDFVLSQDRNCYAAWLGKGTALKFLNRYKEALECYEKALTLNRDSIMAECLAGFLREEMEQNKNA